MSWKLMQEESDNQRPSAGLRSSSRQSTGSSHSEMLNHKRSELDYVRHMVHGNQSGSLHVSNETPHFSFLSWPLESWQHRQKQFVSGKLIPLKGKFCRCQLMIHASTKCLCPNIRPLNEDHHSTGSTLLSKSFQSTCQCLDHKYE